MEWIDNYDHSCATTKDNIEFESDGHFTASFYDSSCTLDTETSIYLVEDDKLVIMNDESTMEITENILTLKVESSPGYGDIMILKKAN